VDVQKLNHKDKGGKNNMKIKYTSRGLKADLKRRSKENWERGRGAKKKGNPRYKPVMVTGKDDVRRKCYKLRKRK